MRVSDSGSSAPVMGLAPRDVTASGQDITPSTWPTGGALIQAAAMAEP
jgi:hypothetical protein